MANEEKRLEWEDGDSDSGEISMFPTQVQTSQEASSIGASADGTSGNERVATFVELLPKFRALQQEISQYESTHKPSATSYQPSTPTYTASTPSKPKPSATSYQPSTPTLRRGVRTGGQIVCDIVCFFVTLALYAVALLAYGYDPVSGEVLWLPQFIFDDSGIYRAPLMMAIDSLEHIGSLGALLRVASYAFLGINAIVFFVQMNIFLIKCFVGLCKGNCTQVRYQSMKMFRTLIFHSLAFAMLGNSSYNSRMVYQMSPLMQGMIFVAGVAYLIVALCNAPNQEDSVQRERFVWKNRLLGILFAFVMLQIFSQTGILSYSYSLVLNSINNLGYIVSDLDQLFAMMVEVFAFIVLCIFAKRAEYTLGVAMGDMLCRRHSYVDYRSYYIEGNDRYLSHKITIILSAIVVVASVVFCLGPSYNEEMFLQQRVLPFIWMLLLGIGAQIGRSIGKRG